MKDWWKWLLLCEAAVIVSVIALLVLSWHGKRHAEVTMLKTEGGSEAWCAIVPSFELLPGTEMTLITSFWVQASSNYVVAYGDGQPDGNLNVTEGGVITLAHDLHLGWNEIYFSYAQAVPECWSVYSVWIWAPYFYYPWEESPPLEEKPLPAPVHDALQARID